MTQSKLNAKTPADVMPHSRVKSCLRRGVELAGTIGLQVGALGALAIAGNLSLGQAVSAQTAITSISTTYSNETLEDYSTKTTNPCDNGSTKVFACNTNAKIVFGSGTSDNLDLNSVTAGGTIFSYRGLANKIRGSAIM